MIVTVSGTPSVCSVILEGSHDGYNWTDIGKVQSLTGGLLTTGSDAALVTWVRADLRELEGIGQVTVTIASDDGT
jgi:hypothetical protein